MSTLVCDLSSYKIEADAEQQNDERLNYDRGSGFTALPAVRW